jgi:hypothetical protein
MPPKAYPYLDTDGNLGIRAGDDWAQILTFDDGAATPQKYDFTNCAAVLQVRNKKGVLILEAKTADGSIVLGGAAGTLAFAIAAAVTRPLAVGMHEYGLKVTDRDGQEKTWLSAAFEVAKELVK